MAKDEFLKSFVVFFISTRSVGTRGTNAHIVGANAIIIGAYTPILGALHQLWDLKDAIQCNLLY